MADYGTVVFNIDFDATAGYSTLQNTLAKTTSDVQKANTAMANSSKQVATANKAVADSTKTTADAQKGAATATQSYAESLRKLLGGLNETGKAKTEMGKRAQSLAQGLANLTGASNTVTRALMVGGVAGAAALAASAILRAGEKVFGAIVAFTSLGQTMDDVSRGFRALTQRSGGSPVEFLQAMQKETLGLVSNMQLMKTANEAIILGLPVSAGEMAKITRTAMLLGRTMGLDVNYALQSVVLGLGRQSRLWLDNIGIIVKAEEAYADYAREAGKSVDALTTYEMKIAFYNAGIKAMEEASKGLTFQVETLAMAFTMLRAQTETVTQSYGMFVNRAINVDSAVAPLADLMQTMGQLAYSARNVATGIGMVVNAWVKWNFGWAITGMKMFSDQAKKVISLLEYLNTKLEPIFGKREEEQQPMLQQLQIPSADKLIGTVNDLKKALSEAQAELATSSNAAYRAAWQAIVDDIELKIQKARQQAGEPTLLAFGIADPGLDEVLGRQVDEWDAAMRSIGAVVGQQVNPEVEKLRELNTIIADVRAASAIDPFRPWADTLVKLNDEKDKMLYGLGQGGYIAAAGVKSAESRLLDLDKALKAVDEATKKLNATKQDDRDKWNAANEVLIETRKKLEEAQKAVDGIDNSIKKMTETVSTRLSTIQDLVDLFSQTGEFGNEALQALTLHTSDLGAEFDEASQKMALFEGQLLFLAQGAEAAGMSYEKWSFIVSGLIGQLDDLSKRSGLAPGALPSSITGKGEIFPGGPEFSNFQDLTGDTSSKAQRLAPGVEQFVQGSAETIAAIDSLRASLQVLRTAGLDPTVASTAVYQDTLDGVMEKLWELVQAGAPVDEMLRKQAEAWAKARAEADAWDDAIDAVIESSMRISQATGNEFASIGAQGLELMASMNGVSDAMVKTYAGLQMMGNLAGLAGFDKLQKGIQKIQAAMLLVTGIKALYEGAVKVATAIFPPDPLQMAGGLAQMAEGASAIAMAKQLGASGPSPTKSAAGASTGGGGGGSQLEYATVPSYMARPGQNPYYETGAVMRPYAGGTASPTTVNVNALDSSSFTQFLTEKPENRAAVGKVVSQLFTEG